MVRQVVLKGKGPLKVGEKWICRCGLAKGWTEEDPQPFCDGAHRKTSIEEEGKTYSYDRDGNASVVE